MILAPTVKQRFYDNNNAPLVNGLLFSYVAGTSTKQTTYKDSTGTPNTNPIVLDYRGECDLWLDTTLTYKFVLAPATDTDPPTNPFWTKDNIAGGYSGTINSLQVYYERTAAEIAAGVTPTNYYYPEFYARRYGAPADGISSANTSLANADLVAIQGGSLIIFSPGTYLISANLTLSSGVQMLPGAKFSIAAGVTLTFAAHAKVVAADNMQIFSGLGGVSYATDSVATTYASWYGFGHAFTGAQNKAALVKAMAALTSGGTIELPKAGFYLDGDIVPPYECLLIRGQGWFSGYNNNTRAGTTIIANSGTNLFDLSNHFGTANPNEYFKIEGCKLDGNGAIANGIKIMGTKTVSGCLITGFTTRGIWLADYINQTLIEKTTCVSNGIATGGIGLHVEGTQTTKFEIADCNFRLNSSGMRINAGYNYTLQDCVFESNSDRGLLETNADNSGLSYGLHLNLWFENNNSIAGTRNQCTLTTTATSATWYPRGHKWIGGNINGGSVVGQRACDINGNCFDTVFDGTRFGGVAADTSAVFVASGTRTIFRNCDGDAVTAIYNLMSASDGNFALTGSNVAAETRTGAGAVSPSIPVTWIVTTGVNALTLANAFEGVEKTIIMKTNGGNGTLTPANLGNGTTITFSAVGNSASLKFTNGKWYFMGGTATLA